MVTASQLCHCCLALFLIFYGVDASVKYDEEFKRVARENGIDPDNPAPGTIVLSPPTLSPEEEGSQFMPTGYRCDSCTAIAYQLNMQFNASEKKKKKGDPLSEAEILEATENVCESDFAGYGLKNVQGTNYLSGEGLLSNEMSGMVESGGKWTKRLQNMCKEIMGLYEEESVYSYYQVKEIPLKQFICEEYCNFHGVRPIKDEF